MIPYIPPWNCITSCQAIGAPTVLSDLELLAKKIPLTMPGSQPQSDLPSTGA